MERNSKPKIVKPAKSKGIFLSIFLEVLSISLFLYFFYLSRTHSTFNFTINSCSYLHLRSMPGTEQFPFVLWRIQIHRDFPLFCTSQKYKHTNRKTTSNWNPTGFDDNLLFISFILFFLFPQKKHTLFLLLLLLKNKLFFFFFVVLLKSLVNHERTLNIEHHFPKYTV